MKKMSLISILACLVSLQAFGQSKKINSQKVFEKEIADCLYLKSDLIKDSVLIYVFNFKLDIIRNINGKTKVKHITVNDSLAYKLFPTYKKLYDIDYRHLGQKRQQFSVVVPVLIFYKNHNDNAMISMNAAVNAVYSLHSPIVYDNEKEKDQTPESRSGVQHSLYPNYGGELQDFVFLPIYFFSILNISKN